MDKQNGQPMPIIPGLPTEGWSYCPRCDDNSMLTLKSHEEYECPICGLGMAVGITGPDGSCTLQATKPITIQEAWRYQRYCTKLLEAHKQQQDIKNAPPRIQLAYHIFTLIGAFLGVKPKLLEDLWNKGGT